MKEVLQKNNLTKNTVGILYICTGEYTVFWDEFYDSYEAFFLPNTEKHYLIFTDDDAFDRKNNERVHVFYQKQLGWPYDTLMRFAIFLNREEQIGKYDYLFFMNSNCACINIVTEEEFLPKEKKLIVVKHPGFWDKDNMEFTYERNKKSTAFIPNRKGTVYVCGGINGGETAPFIQLLKELRDMVTIDINRGVMPLWHDESILNKYVYTHPQMFQVLSPAYCYPEGQELPFEKKIFIRDKSKYIDVDNIKGVKKEEKKLEAKKDNDSILSQILNEGKHIVERIINYAK